MTALYTLRDAIINAKNGDTSYRPMAPIELAEEDIEELSKLLTVRCNLKTKAKMERCLRRLALIKPAGILDGVVKVKHGQEESSHWAYYAGQSYPDEICTVREVILGK